VSLDLLPRTVDVAIVGAGQAGLTMSALLRDSGREHLILERRETLGGGWQDRWDAFQLVTPNWSASFPGSPYDGDQPDDFMTRDEIVGRVRRFAERILAPVALETEVQRLTPLDGAGPQRFRLETSRGPVDATDVVVAAGGFHRPRVPAVAGDLSPRVTQLHSQAYRNESGLPPGGVLVVGSGQSGVQLAEELFEAGRDVTLSVGRAGRMPRRYRGRDVFGWLRDVLVHGAAHGVGLPTVDMLPDPRLRFAGNPHLSGHGGGHDTNLRKFARDGIRLVGRVDAADGERVRFAPGLADNLRFADRFFDERFRPQIDSLIERSGLDAPSDDREVIDFEPPEVADLDLAGEGISTVLWTSGYALDFGWIKAPIFDEMGAPRHVRGVSEIAGLSFVGLPWQLDQVSATLLGVRRDAEYLADRLTRRP